VPDLTSEAALRETAERYRLIVESALDYAIFTIDGERRVTSWPPGAQAVFGWRPEEIIGQLVDITFTPEDRAAGAPEWEVGVARSTGHAPDVRWHVCKDGEGVFIEGSLRPLNDGNGIPTSFVKIGQDVTDRRRAEAALRESEERFRQFADASADVLWIRDAETLEMEFLSPAFETVYGAPVSQLLGKGPREWAALIVPDDREAALAAIQQARSGTVTHQFRIMRPSDAAFRWIRNTNFPLRDAQGQVRRIAGIAADMTEQKKLVDHQAVLLAELQHRVRNIMAMLRAITARTAGTAESVKDYAKSVTGRLIALARTQTLLTRSTNFGVDLSAVITSELAAQAARADQYEVSGPVVTISPKAAEVLALAVHELATNSLKYGAFSSQDGHVNVNWRTARTGDQFWVHLDWRERGPVPEQWQPPARRGFGTELIERRVPYELGGKGSIQVRAGEVDASIEFPLQDGASILETDAPLPSRVHGGEVDMSTEVDLGGQRVLVLEDDFYLAADSEQALRSCGAQVVGPFADEAAAIAALDAAGITAALVDINPGTGPSFRIADALRARAIPFVFVTGYDRAVVPGQHAQVPLFEKPVDLRSVVRAVAQLTGNMPLMGKMA
jgi:PAS domain S-box-containing protein